MAKIFIITLFACLILFAQIFGALSGVTMPCNQTESKNEILRDGQQISRLNQQIISNAWNKIHKYQAVMSSESEDNNSSSEERKAERNEIIKCE